jgi:hypothetical protein
MALLRLIGVDTATGQQKLQESGDTYFAPDFLNIGSATSAVATGDLATSDGTREMFWDASANLLSLGAAVTGTATTTLRIGNTGSQGSVTITTDGTSSPPTFLIDGTDGGASGTRLQFQTGDSTTNAGGEFAIICGDGGTSNGVGRGGGFIFTGGDAGSGSNREGGGFQINTGDLDGTAPNPGLFTVRIGSSGQHVFSVGDSQATLGGGPSWNPNFGAGNGLRMFFGTLADGRIDLRDDGDLGVIQIDASDAGGQTLLISDSTGISASGNRHRLNGGIGYYRLGYDSGSAVARGDFSAGDSTRELFWDASAGAMTINTTNTVNAGVNGMFFNLTNTSGVGGANLGTQITWNAENANSVLTQQGGFKIDWQDATHTSEYSQALIATKRGGTNIAAFVLGNTTTAAGNNRAEFNNNAGTRTVTIDMDQESLQIGQSASAPGGAGDIVAGDGTRQLEWDASEGRIVMTGLGAQADAISINANVNGQTRIDVINTNAGASASCEIQLVSDTATLSIQQNSSGASAANRGHVTVNSGDLLLGTTTSGSVDIVVPSGEAVQVNSLPLPTVLSSTTDVDLDTVSTDALYTVPSGQSAIITAVIVRLTAATAPNGDAVVSVGTNASTYDNIVAATTLTGLNTLTESYTIDIGGITHIAVNSDGAITFQVDTADTGGASVTATVDLIGYLF